MAREWFEVKIEGLKELETKLNQIEKTVAKRIVRTALRKGQKLLLDTAKSYVKAISKGGGMAEKIARALQLKVPKKQDPGSYTIQVQLKPDPDFVHYAKGSFSYLYNKKGTGPGKTVGRTYAPSAIEYGHGKNKDQAARPWMRPAADSTERQRTKIFADYVFKEIDKIWSKK